MYSQTETNNFYENNKYTLKETQVTVITNKADDFGEDISINLNGKNVIIPANTTKLHYYK
jgi:HJR/Mrr/RecB family endonuclease